MGTSNFAGPIVDRQGDPGNAANPVTLQKNVSLTLANGAASAQIVMPPNTFVQHVWFDTPVAIPGTPTTTNIRLGSTANGQQYVADVDAKAQGLIAATILYPLRNNPGTIFATVASTGGTAALQVGTITVRISYSYT